MNRIAATVASTISLSISLLGIPNSRIALAVELDTDSPHRLTVPAVTAGTPAAGRRVKATPPEYAGTEVHHTLYLPKSWTPRAKDDGTRLPIIFEYTGNYFAKSGSTGKVQDASLGYGLSGGKYIWVCLPCVSADGKANEVTWWGDSAKTVDYAKRNVPRIIETYGADPNAVFLCGFSRGAIGVNYLGLHDDAVAKLWTAFITHDHFDGVSEWRGTKWGSPLPKYRDAAARRLKRVGGRPYLVCQNGMTLHTEQFVRSALPMAENFAFRNLDTHAILGDFPNDVAIHPHTDCWLLKPSAARTATWQWMNTAAKPNSNRD
jgi:hypothetical protein